MLTEFIHRLQVQTANMEELQTSQDPIKVFNFRQLPKKLFKPWKNAILCARMT